MGYFLQILANLQKFLANWKFWAIFGIFDSFTGSFILKDPVKRSKIAKNGYFYEILAKNKKFLANWKF